MTLCNFSLYTVPSPTVSPLLVLAIGFYLGHFKKYVVVVVVVDDDDDDDNDTVY